MMENLAVVSHELRNSLGIIRNATRVIETSPWDVPLVTKSRQLIERQIHQMERLIGDLLEVSRVNGDAGCLQRERIDLRLVATDAVESIKPEIHRRRQRLTVVLPEAPVWLYADAGRLGQVLLNLLGNAAKYTDTGGEVRLSIEQESEVATVRVKDSGIGIAPALLPHVFEPFMQARSALPRSEMGLGIGLALVTNIVALHGGHVTAASAGLGQGSEFTVYLPITAS
jgi:two-component system, sensor histidine kinase